MEQRRHTSLEVTSFPSSSSPSLSSSSSSSSSGGLQSRCGAAPGDAHDARDSPDARDARDARDTRVSRDAPDTYTRDASETVDNDRHCSVFNFTWGDFNGESFVQNLLSAYAEIVHWRRNIFFVPSGSSGKTFVRELARLLRTFTENSALAPVAMTAVMTMPHLLLQKPTPKSRCKEHSSHLDRRLALWKSGNIEELMQESRAIQVRLLNQTRRNFEKDPNRLAASFAKLMFQGRTRAALRLLDESQAGGGLLSLDSVPSEGQTVRQILKEKHPSGHEPSPEVLLQTTDHEASRVHPIVFEPLDANCIRKAALKVEGGAGPSGLDADAWRRLCMSFKSASDDLCNAMAGFAKRLCTEELSETHLTAYIACRLVPLDKNPGVRPIGIGEVLRRIVGKAVLSVIGKDVQKAAGSLQLCAGQPSGIEAAIHAMSNIFDQKDTEAVLLVDADNAFNRLNRKAALHNIGVMCPSLSTILKNTYSAAAQLFVGGEVVLSEEGTTQGDPLAMPMYAIGIVPLIHELSRSNATQAWFADDANGAGKLVRVKNWWDLLNERGPEYGYFPKAAKTCLLVKESVLDEAKKVFGGTGVQIKTDGCRLLGSALGKDEFVLKFVRKQVESLVGLVHVLSGVAKSQPHAAFAALTHGLMGKWTFLSRTVESAGSLLQPLERAMCQRLIPSITGRDPPGEQERTMFGLPVHLGGLGIKNPAISASLEYEHSCQTSKPLTEMLKDQCQQDILPVCMAVTTLRREAKSKRRAADSALALKLGQEIRPELQHSLQIAGEKGASNWLSALPMERHGFVLYKSAFRDALCLRYGWEPPNLPANCVCGQSFSTQHALSCPTGGIPTIRHNSVRDLTATLMDEVCHDVVLEPRLQPLSGESLQGRTSNREDEARLDIRASGFWGGRFERAFFDVRVFNPKAPTNRNPTMASTYARHEKEKRRNYQQRVTEIEHASFTPLVFSASGGMAKAAQICYKRLAGLLAEKRKEPYSQVMGWMRTTLSFCLLRSAILCLRGSRQKTVNLSPEPTGVVMSEAHL